MRSAEFHKLLLLCSFHLAGVTGRNSAIWHCGSQQHLLLWMLHTLYATNLFPLLAYYQSVPTCKATATNAVPISPCHHIKKACGVSIYNNIWAWMSIIINMSFSSISAPLFAIHLCVLMFSLCPPMGLILPLDRKQEDVMTNWKLPACTDTIKNMLWSPSSGPKLCYFIAFNKCAYLQTMV